MLRPTQILLAAKPLLGLAHARFKEYDQARNLPTSRSWPEPTMLVSRRASGREYQSLARHARAGARLTAGLIEMATESDSRCLGDYFVLLAGETSNGWRNAAGIVVTRLHVPSRGRWYELRVDLKGPITLGACVWGR